MRRLTLLIVITILLGALSACGGDEAPSPTATPLPPTAPPATPTPERTATPTPLPAPAQSDDLQTRAQLRIVDAGNGFPNLSFYLDGEEIARGFRAGNYHRQPLAFQAGDYLLRVVRAGDNPDTDPRILEQVLTLEAGSSTAAILTGTPEAPQLILAQEDLAPMPQETVRLRVVHAAPNAGEVRVQANGRTLADALSFGAVSEALELPAEDFTLSFTRDGEALASHTLYTRAGNVYTVVLYGDAPFQTLDFHNQAASEARVRVVHVSPDAPALAVYLDETPLGEPLAFGQASDWHNVPARRYTVRVLPADAAPDAVPLAQKDVSLRPYAAVDLVLLDTQDRLRILNLDEDLSPTADDETRFTFVNAAVGLTRLWFSSPNGDLDALPPLSFGTATRPFAYAADEEEILVLDSTADDANIVARLPQRNYRAGRAYTFIFTGEGDIPAIVLETEVGTFAENADGVAPTAAPVFGAPTARPSLRMVNALGQDVPLTLEVDGEVIFDNVRRAKDTLYHTFDAPPQNYRVLNSATGEVLLEGPLLDLDGAAVLRGTMFVYQTSNGFDMFVADDAPLQMPGNRAYVRIFHAAPAYGDLRLTAPVPAPADEEQTFEEATNTPAPLEMELLGEAYFGVVSNPILLEGGTHTLYIERADNFAQVLEIPALEVEAGRSYDLLLLPAANGAPRDLAAVLIARPD